MEPSPSWLISDPHCPQVLVVEMNKVLLPARLQVQGEELVDAVTLSLLEPKTQVRSLLSPYSPVPLSAPLLSYPSSSIFHQTLHLWQGGEASWTFPVASICGVR